MYNHSYHSTELDSSTFLVTGGAGFIGTNITEYLLKHNAKKVMVLDNLSNGFKSNIERFLEYQNFEFIEGDITDLDTCNKVCTKVDYVIHQAALGSVPRSIDNPMATHHANITGTLNIFLASKDSKVKRVVYASSSSVYGDDQNLPKKEGLIGNPLSPYAVSKLTCEKYGYAFYENFGLETVGLRYFNVFGPRQSPDLTYAAVIPLFAKAVLNQQAPKINGDGEQSRDFTFIENVVQANIKSLFSSHPKLPGSVLNVGNEKRTTINQLFISIKSLLGSEMIPIYGPERPGDVRNSLSDISKAKELIGYKPEFTFHEGMELTMDWYKTLFS